MSTRLLRGGDSGDRHAVVVYDRSDAGTSGGVWGLTNGYCLMVGGDDAAVKRYVDDSGEGRWTVQAAIDQNVPAPVITMSLLSRFVSRQDESFSAKMIAALRNQFGGHAIQPEPEAASVR